MRLLVRINVGGKTFRINYETVSKYPDTKLATEVNKAFKQKNVTKLSEESLYLFFDRNASIFETVFDFYRTGELHIPRNVCRELVKEELLYWGISQDRVAPCCWEILSGQQNISDMSDVKSEIAADVGSLKMKLWLLLEEPSSSMHAKIWSFTYMVLLLSSFLAFAAQTCNVFRYRRFNHHMVPLLAKKIDTSNPKVLMFVATEAYGCITWAERVCNIVFTIEFLMRFIVSGNKRRFFTNPLNILDTTVIPAIWVCFAMGHYPKEFLHDSFLYTYITIQAFVVLRLLRLFRFSRHFPALKIIYLSVWSNREILTLLIAVVVFIACVFSGLMFAAELSHPDSFPDIFVALWWALITMTTVGYGDYYPHSVAGQLVAVICTVFGIIALALPIALMVKDFGVKYSTYDAKRRRCIRLNAKKAAENLSIRHIAT